MWTEEKLDKMLTTPSEALSKELAALDGDILVLGAGGKMGPTLCVLAKNALRAAGSDKRVIAVSRFSDPFVVELLTKNEVEMISADLLQPGHNGVAAAVGDAAVEYIEIGYTAVHTLGKIAVAHGELVEIA